MAILIGQQVRNAFDMIDAQPAPVIEALIEYAKRVHICNSTEHRYGVRAAIIEYLEQRLQEARAQERKLVQATTGTEDLPDD